VRLSIDEIGRLRSKPLNERYGDVMPTAASFPGSGSPILKSRGTDPNTILTSLLASMDALIKQPLVTGSPTVGTTDYRRAVPHGG
jgi:hypothetical protein